MPADKAVRRGVLEVTQDAVLTPSRAFSLSLPDAHDAEKRAVGRLPAAFVCLLKPLLLQSYLPKQLPFVRKGNFA